MHDSIVICERKYKVTYCKRLLIWLKMSTNLYVWLESYSTIWMLFCQKPMVLSTLNQHTYQSNTLSPPVPPSQVRSSRIAMLAQLVKGITTPEMSRHSISPAANYSHSVCAHTNANLIRICFANISIPESDPIKWSSIWYRSNSLVRCSSNM